MAPVSPPPTGEPAREALVAEVRALQRAFSDASWRLAEPGDFTRVPELTPQQFRVLGLIAASPGIGSSQVSQVLGVSAPTASGIVDRLVERGLLARQDDPHDRRLRRLTLTPAAEERLRDVESLRDRMFDRLVPHLDTDLIVTIRDAFQGLVAAVDEATPDAR